MMLKGHYKNNLPAQWASTFDLSWSVIACNAFRRCRCIGRHPAGGRLPSQRRRKTYGPRSVGDWSPLAEDPSFSFWRSLKERFFLQMLNGIAARMHLSNHIIFIEEFLAINLGTDKIGVWTNIIACSWGRMSMNYPPFHEVWKWIKDGIWVQFVTLCLLCARASFWRKNQFLGCGNCTGFVTASCPIY